MTIDTFFAGMGGIILGTILGSLLTAKLTYDFNKRLLDAQLEANRKSHDEIMNFLRDAHKGFAEQFKNISSSITMAIIDTKRD